MTVTQVVHTQPRESPKSRLAALLFCFFLGYLGVHRFYVGRVGSGILYLCTYGLFGIGWLVDIILILAGALTDDRGLPVTSWDGYTTPPSTTTVTTYQSPPQPQQPQYATQPIASQQPKQKLKYCPTCGTANEVQSTYCASCGSVLDL